MENVLSRNFSRNASRASENQGITALDSPVVFLGEVTTFLENRLRDKPVELRWRSRDQPEGRTNERRQQIKVPFFPVDRNTLVPPLKYSPSESFNSTSDAAIVEFLPFLNFRGPVRFNALVGRSAHLAPLVNHLVKGNSDGH